MHWTYLLLAGLFEIGFAVSLKLMDNHRNIPFTILFYICIISSFFFLEKAAERIPIGTAYAIWTGIGASGTALIGILFLKEPSNVGRLVFLVMLICSIAGLKLTSS